jgi:hypothetical protein
MTATSTPLAKHLDDRAGGRSSARTAPSSGRRRRASQLFDRVDDLDPSADEIDVPPARSPLAQPGYYVVYRTLSGDVKGPIEIGRES